LWRTIGNWVLAIVSDMKGNVLTRFITPFGFHSTAAEVINGVNLASRRAIVTGGASGIGIETARALAGAGASVTLAVRRPDAAESVAIELRRSTGNHAIDIRTLDLSDLRSVKSFTATRGKARCTSWSTTPASWQCPNLKRPLRESSCSSAPTSSGTSR
jgi:hypothetical protein